MIAYGVMPFISVLFIDSRTALLFGVWNLPFNGSIAFLYGPDGEASFILVFISLFLCIFTVGGTIWAFTGDRAGRAAALTFLTADVLWWCGLTVVAITMADVRPSDKIGWILELLAPSIWLGVIWWNFTRPDLNAYYEFKSTVSE